MTAGRVLGALQSAMNAIVRGTNARGTFAAVKTIGNER